MYNQLIIFHNKNMHKFVPDLFNRKCLDHCEIELHCNGPPRFLDFTMQ